jgi:hypothetical protein
MSTNDKNLTIAMVAAVFYLVVILLSPLLWLYEFNLWMYVAFPFSWISVNIVKPDSYLWLLFIPSALAAAFWGLLTYFFLRINSRRTS